MTPDNEPKKPKKTSLGWGGPLHDGSDTPHEIQRKLANSMDSETFERKDQPTAYVSREEYEAVVNSLKEVTAIAEYYHCPRTIYTEAPYHSWRNQIDNAKKLLP